MVVTVTGLHDCQSNEVRDYICDKYSIGGLGCHLKKVKVGWVRQNREAFSRG